jgi:predicted amidophosphoribosyltransferase
MKTCPLCAEEIRPNALICKHCGRPYLADVGQLCFLRLFTPVPRAAERMRVPLRE